jgi:hypothetical protein
LRHAESNGGLNHRQDWVQNKTLLVVFGDVVWVFHCKSKNGVSTNVLSKSNHTHGGVITDFNAQGSPRIRLRFICGKHSSMQGFVLKALFKTSFPITKGHTMLIHTDPNFKPLPDSPSAVAYGTTAEHFPNDSHLPIHSQEKH